MNSNDSGFKSIGMSTIEAKSSLDTGRRSRAIEGEVSPADKFTIRDMAERGLGLDDIFAKVTAERNKNNRPLVTMPAVARFLEEVSTTLADERCVVTGEHAVNYAEIRIIVGQDQICKIRIPVSKEMATKMVTEGVSANSNVGYTKNLQPSYRVVSGENLPVLPGSKWIKTKKGDE